MKRITFVIVCCLWLLVAASTCFAQMYTVTDLGTLGGTDSVATGINASGQVVGYSTKDNAAIRAFRTAPNSPINPATDDLGFPCAFENDCVDYAYATGINDSGQVIGDLHVTFDDFFSFRTAPNGPLKFPDDSLGPAFTAATGINNSGQVVGFFYFDAPSSFRTAPNSPINPATDDLGTLSLAGYSPTYGGGLTYAYGINDSGQVVGSSDLGDKFPFTGSAHAYRTAANAAINPATDDLGTLGGSYSEAVAINAFGQVAGNSSITDYLHVHAFRTAPNSSINPASDDLGTLGGSWSQATDINDYGEVVGWASISDTASHVFLYSSGALHDLNNLIPVDSSCALVVGGGVWYLNNGLTINNAGKIAATGYCGGRLHAVLLTPIYRALVQPPINADGSSVFSVKRRVIPVKFKLTKDNASTCTLPPATIAITKAAGGTLASVGESIYSIKADDGSNFRIDPTACQYVYNLAASSLGVGTYLVNISINGLMVGHAFFVLK